MDENTKNSAIKPAFSHGPRKTPQGRARDRFVKKTPDLQGSKKFKENLESVPARYKARYERCLTGRAGLSEVVKITCAECVCFDNVPEQVRECGSWRCPIWLYRPYQD